MAHAYTPGLRVSASTTVRKERMLPLEGTVHVSEGERVRAEQVVASTELPGDVTIVNIAHRLSCAPEEVPETMLYQEGDGVEAGDKLAESKGIWGMFRTACEAPKAGTIESISGVTGQVALRAAPMPVEVRAYLDGEVVEAREGAGVTVECRAALVQGIIGLCGEAFGVLRRAVEEPGAVVDADRVPDDCEGCILVGGSLVTHEAIVRAVEAGAAGLVTGGIEYDDLERFLGYPLGVAITGQEDLGLTLVVTEGFGAMPMAGRTFDLLASLEGQRAAMTGQTQIRAGVIRPEVVIPQSDGEAEEEASLGLVAGSPVRLIRAPYFGRLAEVAELPEALETIESEAKVRVLVAELDTGERVRVPRANVELIEG